jgi:hypothetical protein
MELELRKEVLFEGLNADERRRLFFLLFITDQLEFREALPWAERIEAFIRGKAVSRFDPGGPSPCAVPTAHIGMRAADENGMEIVTKSSADKMPGTGEIAEQGETTSDGKSMHVSSTASSAGATNSRPTLDKSSHVEFFKAVARGATNAELATHFGLTKRQAHALRIGITRRTRSVGAAAPPGNPRLSATECLPLEQMEADVVRFLRQIGDVVVKEGESFLVNSILQLNFHELLARANSKRLQRGKPTFDLPKHSGPDLASIANGSGGGEDRV